MPVGVGKQQKDLSDFTDEQKKGRKTIMQRDRRRKSRNRRKARQYLTPAELKRARGLLKVGYEDYREIAEILEVPVTVVWRSDVAEQGNFRGY